MPTTHQTHKSRIRVRDHAEVFTHEREVNAMLDLVDQETQRIESRFLEPACGTGNFLKEILRRKLHVVKQRYRKSQLEYERNSIIALSSIYGIDILKDNTEECRLELLEIFVNEYKNIFKSKIKKSCIKSAEHILSRNILWGNALDLETPDEKKDPIVFSEWTPVNSVLIKRRDYTMDNMIKSSPPPSEGGQIGWINHDEMRPTPIADYPATHFLKIGESA